MHVHPKVLNASGETDKKQRSYLSAAQGLVRLVFAAVCVAPLARGHATGVSALQELPLLDVSCQQQLEQHLELEAARSGLTSPLLLHAHCSQVAASPTLPLPVCLCQMAQVWNMLCPVGPLRLGNWMAKGKFECSGRCPAKTPQPVEWLQSWLVSPQV